MATRHVKIVNPVRGWCAIEIPRCGCTGLKERVWKDVYKEGFSIEKEGIDLHRRLGYTAEESGGLVVEWDYDTSNLFHFAVWRPPIDRCISTWLGFTRQQTIHGYFKHVIGCSWDEWVTFLVDEFQHDSLQMDPHIRRQVDFYCESDVNVIVPIHILDKWLAEKFGHEPMGKINHAPREEVCVPLPSSFAAGEVVKMYARDALIPLSRKFIGE